MSQVESIPSVPAHRGAVFSRSLSLLLVSHAAVDVYSAIVPPILVTLKVHAGLTDVQTAWLLGSGSLASGLSQPVAAWLVDRYDNRLFGVAGLVVSAVALSAIGWATTFPALLSFYIVGMIGVGVFHPVGASCVGHLADVRKPGSRSAAMSMFFVAGMLGGIAGSILSPLVTGLDRGFFLLGLWMIPGLALAVVLYPVTRGVSHRHDHHDVDRTVRPAPHAAWWTIAVLYVGNAMRFTVNVALIYLIARWAEALVSAANIDSATEEVARLGSNLAGRVNAMMIVGMAVGGVASGYFVRVGRERWPLILVPIVASPFVMLVPYAGSIGAMVVVVPVGMGFAGMIPVTLSLAQRALPRRTALASGLMLGGAWAIAIVGPRCAAWLLNAEGPAMSLETVFALTAGLLAVSGLVSVGLRRIQSESPDRSVVPSRRSS